MSFGPAFQIKRPDFILYLRGLFLLAFPRRSSFQDQWWGVCVHTLWQKGLDYLVASYSWCLAMCSRKGTTGPSAPFAGKQSFDDAIRGRCGLGCGLDAWSPFCWKNISRRASGVFEAHVWRELRKTAAVTSWFTRSAGHAHRLEEQRHQQRKHIREGPPERPPLFFCRRSLGDQ